MECKVSKELVLHRLEQAKEDVKACEVKIINKYKTR